MKNVTLAQKWQAYLACCETSNFLMIFLKEAPYLVPYLPAIPTLTVLLVILDFSLINFFIKVYKSRE